MIDGSPISSGVSINERTSLQISAVLACVRVLSETLACVPLPVYERLESGGKRRAPEHRLYHLLHNQPNPEMTSFTWRELAMVHLVLWGNHYSEIIRDQGYRVKALWPIPPNQVKQRRKYGDLVYQIDSPKRQSRTLTRDRVFHIPGMGYNGIEGYSLIRLTREAIGLAKATELFGASFFGNNASPGGVLEYPGKLSEEGKGNLKQSWNERHKGPDKVHGLAVLEEGTKWHQISVAPENAQFLETRKFQVSDIARIFRVPPHMIGDLEKATFSNIEQQSIEFVKYTMMPWFSRWEQALNTALFSEKERQRYFVEFIVEGLLRGDIQSRYQAYHIARQDGIISADEWRELENMNPLPEGKGKIYYMPLNMAPVGSGLSERFVEIMQRVIREDNARQPEQRELRNQEKIIKNRRKITSSYLPIIRDTTARIIRRERHQIMKAAKEHLQNRNMQTFETWLDEVYDEIGSYVRDRMFPIFSAIGANMMGQIGSEI
jgi:HK97 family phage portal protein